MKRTSFAQWPCSIARTMDLLGDWWTPLVLRDAFYGVRRFDEFQQALGIARNTLADRLKRLVEEGLLEKVAYQVEPVRYDYVLTEKGRDFYPVLLAMTRWGDKWLAAEAGPPITVHHTRLRARHARRDRLRRLRRADDAGRHADAPRPRLPAAAGAAPGRRSAVRAAGVTLTA